MKPLDHWPTDFQKRITGVFTDIDDTLTTDGTITADALQALADLRAAGIQVILITGRPIGWCKPFMIGPADTVWPVDAMVAENGAVAYMQEGAQPLRKLYQQDAATRAANQARMREIADRVTRTVTGVELSRDSAGRETDLAFDYAEFTRHPPSTVEQVVALLQSEGLQTTMSSIHIHGCFGDFNKWQGACWIVRELLGRDLAQELDRWVFVGDSGNDQAMFEHFTHSVGVANIARFVPQLTHLPRYVTQGERGAGFAEVARAILSKK
ncbi:MAG: HAD-IIB family hydrolase [Gammaproteobacteria bacterium]|nr:HAD-IIB family hydrolase [Gammaproteobacteria bacterium]MBU1505068.1 HAD-IIB family hydrolase [Gammaproteobacteria bacterium]MBU2122267.1 HAD-IIB family hydrolase [Gammaproteobacteria bacterium]MBU2169875.1 HAD-IIB family hydrolase [Gammaproteobacteria bacterium]MBU2198632.1 HAD-IIB family hydrolase [Gammaproteobacteria bacterium]